MRPTVDRTRATSRRALLSLGLAATAVACAVPTPPRAGSGALLESSSAPTAPQRFSYGPKPSQFAELSLPAGTGRVPVVVIVHGGFWLMGYGAGLGQPLALDLVRHGWAALNVEYRRVGAGESAGGGGWPTTCLDVAAAVDALVGPGQELAKGRLDLSSVVGLGHSAGGQLVGWLAGRPGLPSNAPGAAPIVRLSGLVAQAGVLDLVQAANESVGGTAVPDFMGGGPGELPQAYQWASPIARVPLRVPSICIHGTTDNVVPISQSQRFVAAAAAAGDHSSLQTFAGGHFELIDTSTQAWKLCTQSLASLL